MRGQVGDLCILVRWFTFGRFPSVDNAPRTGFGFSDAASQISTPRVWDISRFDTRSRGDGNRTGMESPCSDTKSLRTYLPEPHFFCILNSTTSHPPQRGIP